MNLTKEECERLLNIVPENDGDHVNSSIRRKLKTRLRLADWSLSKNQRDYR